MIIVYMISWSYYIQVLLYDQQKNYLLYCNWTTSNSNHFYFTILEIYVGTDAANDELKLLEGELSSVQELKFAFRRAASRLTEMAGKEYLQNWKLKFKSKWCWFVIVWLLSCLFTECFLLCCYNSSQLYLHRLHIVINRFNERCILKLIGKLLFTLRSHICTFGDVLCGHMHPLCLCAYVGTYVRTGRTYARTLPM